MVLSQWLPHAFPDTLLINPLCAHIVFKRSLDKEWHNPSETSSDGRDSALEEVAWVLVTQRQEVLSVKNEQLLIGTYWYNNNISNISIEIVVYLSRYEGVHSYADIEAQERERERKRERELVRVHKQRHVCSHAESTPPCHSSIGVCASQFNWQVTPKRLPLISIYSKFLIE